MDENENAQQSYLLIQFASPGSVLFQPTFENVTPFQLLAIAHFLEFEGKSMLQEHKFQEKQKEQMNKIITPGKQL